MEKRESILESCDTSKFLEEHFDKNRKRKHHVKSGKGGLNILDAETVLVFTSFCEVIFILVFIWICKEK